MNRSRGQRHVPVSTGIAHRDAGDLEPDTRPPGDVVAVLVEEPDHGRADGAAPEQPDADGPVLRVRFPTAHPSPPIQAAMSISSS